MGRIRRMTFGTRRTLFRARQWRPLLVTAGLIGSVTQDGAQWTGAWTDEDVKRHRVRYATEQVAVTQVAHRQTGGLHYHDFEAFRMRPG